MNNLLEYLAKAEGTEIHRISSEPDITSMYGISRHNHPDAEIFKYIDSMAISIGIYDESKYWSNVEIGLVNQKIDHDTAKNLAAKFYEEYLINAHLYLFPKECQVAMYSMFITSPKGTWIAVQNSIIALVKSDQTGLIISEVSKPDGSYGNKTKNSLEYIQDKVNPMYFETLMILNMLDHYTELALKNPDKYLHVLRGWKNRMIKLSRFK